MGNKSSKLNDSDDNGWVYFDVIDNGGLKQLPNYKYNKKIIFYDDFIHFKGNNRSYIVLKYEELISWSINTLTNHVLLNIIIDNKTHKIKLNIEDIHYFIKLLDENIAVKVEEINYKKMIKNTIINKKINKKKIKINYTEPEQLSSEGLGGNAGK